MCIRDSTRNGGSLRIVKNFAGNAAIPGDTFAFTIRLGRLDGVNVDGTYDALRNGVAEPITFTGGVATVWLGSGDTFEILGILSGTDYAVSEDIPVDSGYIGPVSYTQLYGRCGLRYANRFQRRERQLRFHGHSVHLRRCASSCEQG